MNFIRNNWKGIVIILLGVLFLTTCSRKNNYKRRLLRYGENITLTIDSLEKIIDSKTLSIDSLYDINKQLNVQIDNLNKDIEIYKTQNEKLLNKKVTVIVQDKEKDNIKIQ